MNPITVFLFASIYFHTSLPILCSSAHALCLQGRCWRRYCLLFLASCLSISFFHFFSLSVFSLLQKHMAVIFVLCTIPAVIAMIMCTRFSEFYPDPTDFLLWFTVGNIVNARWEENVDYTFLRFNYHFHTFTSFSTTQVVISTRNTLLCHLLSWHEIPS